MDVTTIVQQLVRWGVPAILGGGVLFLLIVAVFRMSKHALHGSKPLSRTQIVAASLLGSWLMLVLGLTSLSRGSNFTGSLNLHFLSSYVSAWNHWSVYEWQMIVLNMLLFAPLGFLPPLIWKKAEKIWVTTAVSLGASLFVETFQLLTGTGIFEWDDLLHNLLGALFGYFCILAVLSLVRQKTVRLAPIVKALLIPCAVSLALGIAVYAYNRQPYGNMSLLPAVNQDMSAVRMVTCCPPSAQPAAASVYKSKYAQDPNYMHRVKTALEELESISFFERARREGDHWGYRGTNANAAAFQITFFERTGEWQGALLAQNAARLTQQTAQRLKARYEDWMKELCLLPENARFSVQNGDTLRWDIIPAQDISAGSEAFQQGSVMIQLDASGTLSSFSYFVNWNEYVATEAILSPSQAYQQVKDGRFEQYVPFQPGDTLYINRCELDYVYDTKGFYQPVYALGGYLNDAANSWACRVPALAP